MRRLLTQVICVRHLIFMGSSDSLFGLAMVAICPSLIMGCGANALRLLQYEPPYEPSPFARRALLRVTAIALIGLAAGWRALIEDADRFFCVSPDGIMVRRGLLDKAHHYDWRDYKFYVNRTVTPEYCPSELYGHIWNWLVE